MDADPVQGFGKIIGAKHHQGAHRRDVQRRCEGGAHADPAAKAMVVVLGDVEAGGRGDLGGDVVEQGYRAALHGVFRALGEDVAVFLAGSCLDHGRERVEKHFLSEGSAHPELVEFMDQAVPADDLGVAVGPQIAYLTDGQCAGTQYALHIAQDHRQEGGPLADPLRIVPDGTEGRGGKFDEGRVGGGAHGQREFRGIAQRPAVYVGKARREDDTEALELRQRYREIYRAHAVGLGIVVILARLTQTGRDASGRAFEDDALGQATGYFGVEMQYQRAVGHAGGMRVFPRAGEFCGKDRTHSVTQALFLSRAQPGGGGHARSPDQFHPRLFGQGARALQDLEAPRRLDRGFFPVDGA